MSDSIALITSTFSYVLSNYKLISLILGIITCIILIVLLAKRYGYIGTVIGLLISAFLLILMIDQMSIEPTDESSNESLDKFDEKSLLGNIEISIEELILILRYNNEYET